MIGRTLEIKHTDIFEKNWEAYNDPNIRFIINQGGSRSSKSISILQCLISIALKQKVKITIARKTLASCKTIMEDFLDLLMEYDLYEPEYHNKSLSNYILSQSGSTFEFLGVADTFKLHGKKRDILFVNEVIEISENEWVQLMLRTSGKVFMDFNPIDLDHWVFDFMNQNQNYKLIKSTYKDNPFLESDQIKFIESMINVDPNWYRIYTLGEAPTSDIRIYHHFQRYTELDLDQIIDTVYGLDFGYTHACGVVECNKTQLGWYLREVIYETRLTTPELIDRLKTNINKNNIIYCDSARPDIIEDLKRSGFRAKSSDKEVKAGINTIQSSIIFIHADSLNLWNEYRKYSWKTGKNEKPIDEPIKIQDELMDALRYAIHTHKGKEPKDFKTMKFFY